MLAKPAFLLRSLFVAASLASLVACSFEGQPTEEEKGSSSALHKEHASDAGTSKGHKGADGGTVDPGADGGIDESSDAGAGWGTDASVDNGTDAGVPGDDDDDSWGTDAGAGWGTDAG